MARRKTNSGRGQAEVSTTNSPTAGNIDAIREILFGNQTRDYERRLGELERDLQTTCAGIDADLSARLTKLAGELKKELDKLNDRQVRIKRDRTAADKRLAADIRRLSKTFGDRLAALDDHLKTEISKIHEVLQRQRTDLRKDTNELACGLLELLQQEREEIRELKVGRTELAGLFTALATRFRADPESAKD
jgi:hypothetical protein